MRKCLNFRAALACGLVFAFLLNTIGFSAIAQVPEFYLPAPGQMVPLSPFFNPIVLKGIKLDPQNPLLFHFFVDSGDSHLSQDELKTESGRLIKYFLASLTTPEKDLWVNLSPYEKDRIVPQEFGQTEMGRDLLAQDYLLKQITASLIYPESRLGKEFWQKVYDQAQLKYGTTNIPVNTFNKVWIVPEKAVVYENNGAAFVVENHLKVMLEQDYLALKKNIGRRGGSLNVEATQTNAVNVLGSKIIREIIIPALTKEVNEGHNFTQLRQVFYSLILATWYKKKIKNSILNKVYFNQGKIRGVNISAGDKNKIYGEYLKAFKKGVYNYIKEETDPLTNQGISRKYFSGGVQAQMIGPSETFVDATTISSFDRAALSSARLIQIDGNVGWIPNKEIINQAMATKIKAADILEDTDIFKSFLKKGFQPPVVRKILIELIKTGLVSNDFYVNISFKEFDQPTLVHFHDLFPKDFYRIEDVLKESREHIIDLLTQQNTERFTRMGINYYYTAKYISEQMAGVKFEFDVDDFIGEARVAGQNALSDFYYLNSTGGNVSSYTIGYMNHSIADYLQQIWPFFNVREIETLFREVRYVLQEPVINHTDQLALSPEYVAGEIAARYPDTANLIDEISLRVRGVPTKYFYTTVAGAQGEQSIGLKETAGEVLRTLSPKEEKVLKLRHGFEDGKEWTFEEIGQEFDVTRERIRQIEAKAIRQLRAPERARRLRPFLEEDGQVENNVAEAGMTRRLKNDIARHEQSDQVPILEKEMVRKEPLTMAEEAELLNFISVPRLGSGAPGEMSAIQRRILPFVLQLHNPQQIAEEAKCNIALVEKEIPIALGTVRYLLTLGILRQYGSAEQIIGQLIRLTAETPLQRLFRQMKADDLLANSGGDIDSIIEMIMQLYPHLYTEQDIRQLAEKHFEELTARMPYRPRGAGGRAGKRNISSRDVLEAVHHVANLLFTQLQLAGQKAGGRRMMVLRRLIRDQYYQIIKENPVEGLKILKEEINKSDRDPQWKGLLQDAYNFYEQATAFEIRGYNEETEFGPQPLLPAQRFGIWEGVQYLSNPKYESVLHMSQARIGKTMMSLLSAYNVRDKKTKEYAVHRVLYTTKNDAKFEAEKEFKTRTNKDLDLQIIVVDQPRASKTDQRREQILKAIELSKDKTKNIVLIANYEAVRDFPKEMALFAPDAHIIDEVETLRGGEDTKRAPVIFGVPAKYRIGTSARSVVNKKEDVVELLLWARHHTFLPPGSDIKFAREQLEKLSAEELFEALDPIKVRWRRAVVMPEVKDPIEEKEYIPFSPEEEELILKIQSESFRQWRVEEAKPSKARNFDNFFARYQIERQASIDPGLVLPEKKPRELMEMSSKIKRLDQIIDNEINNNGKVVVFVDYVEEIERLKARYEERYGEGSVFGIHQAVPTKARHENIWKFRSESHPQILIGTSETIGSSLNLFQIPGSSFHISTVVRLSRPWNNVDDGDRLVGIGQDHQVIVHTLINIFSEETLARIGPRKTVDQMSDALLKKKKKIFNSVVDGKPVVDEETRKNLEAIAVGIQNGELPAIEHVEAPTESEIEDGSEEEEVFDQEDTPEEVNSAMKTFHIEPVSVSGPGGIDFNPAQMNLQVKKEGEEFKFSFNGIEMDAAQIAGASFTIRQMTPVTNLSRILGFKAA